MLDKSFKRDENGCITLLNGVGICFDNEVGRRRKYEKLSEYEDKIERGELVEVVRCEYELYRPSDDGYTGDRRYYQCNNCNQNYISINDDSLEWDYCPYCRAEITARETLCCVDCEHAEYDGDSYYCENNKGLYSGENVDDVNFDGCDEWEERSVSDAND